MPIPGWPEAAQICKRSISVALLYFLRPTRFYLNHHSSTAPWRWCLCYFRRDCFQAGEFFLELSLLCPQLSSLTASTGRTLSWWAGLCVCKCLWGKSGSPLSNPKCTPTGFYFDPYLDTPVLMGDGFIHGSSISLPKPPSTREEHTLLKLESLAELVWKFGWLLKLASLIFWHNFTDKTFWLYLGDFFGLGSQACLCFVLIIP